MGLLRCIGEETEAAPHPFDRPNSLKPANPVDRETGATIAGAGRGVVRDGAWQPGSKSSGDDFLLNHGIDEAAAVGESGSGLMFGPEDPTLQRVALYHYK